MNGHTYEILLALGVLSPFISFWLLVFIGPKLGKPLAGWVGVVLGMGVPLALAAYVLVGWWFGEDAASRAMLSEHAFRYHWADLGTVPILVGIKLDSLTIAMYFMVTFIAFWIFFFSVGYMSGHSDEVDGKSKYHRFFAFLSLFAFSMLGLVLSSNLLFLFIFWEIVGLCSYLLIGYYFHERVPQYAQMKAFITNRVGDFGFIIGLMLVYFQLGTLDLDDAARIFAEQYAAGTGIFASSFTMFGWSLATIMGVGLFCGAMGKSAQFPLHVWLPDAMAGPTPVSALIHAATMVAAGVYLVARVFRLMTPEALMFVAAIGCITLTLMGLVAMVQTDIKKCLAYSTLSQLGYMIFGLGCGAWIAALFHLITHAFFKAMMFLGSGQVIEGCHHEQDMRKMGGLIKKMPVTALTFLVGVLAISGFGIPGTNIGLGGFFSKDEILAVAWVRTFDWNDYSRHEAEHGEHHASAVPTIDSSDSSSHGMIAGEKQMLLVSDLQHGDIHAASQHDEGHTATGGPRGLKPAAHGEDSPGRAGIFSHMPAMPKWMFYLALFTAYITPFYMMRCWWMTFMGKPRDQHVHDHAHESFMMFFPLIILSVGTCFASYFLFRDLISDASTAATIAPMVLATDGHLHTPAITAAHHWLITGVGGAFVVGFVIAILIYGKGLGIATRIKNTIGIQQIHTVLEHKYYIDELYHLVWVKGCMCVAHVVRFFDTWVLDMTYNTLAKLTERFAAFTGLIIDTHGVDGIYNGIADTAINVGEAMRRPQTGRIRNYVLFAAGGATIVVVLMLLYWGVGSPEQSVAMLTP